MVYLLHTLHIFQDIKVKSVQYGYFPGNGKLANPPTHPSVEVWSFISFIAFTRLAMTKLGNAY